VAQLGNGAANEQSPVLLALDGIVEISSGYFHGCARRPSGSLIT